MINDIKINSLMLKGILRRIIKICILMLLILNIASMGNTNFAKTNNNNLEINSRKYVVYDRKNNRAILGKNENKQTAMASTTKIMTSIVIVESNLDLNKEINVGKKAAAIGGSRLGLKLNDKITINDLLYGLLMKSGNDCAVQLAIECKGSIEEFANEMNRKANQLGLVNTNFKTPHGLDDPMHYTTPYELAKITDYALKNDLIATIVKTKYATIKINDIPKEIKNTNELLMAGIDGIYGVKTGFTNIAGRCLVTAVKRDKFDLIIVVIGADTKKDRGKDTLKLIEYVSKNYVEKSVEEQVKQDFERWKQINQDRIIVNKASTKLNTKIGKIENKKVLTNQEITIKINNLTYLESPIEKNTKIGEIIIYNGNNILEKVDILTENEIKRKNIKDYFVLFAKELIL